MKKILKISLITILIMIILFGICKNYSEASSYSGAMRDLIGYSYSDTTGTSGKVNTVTGTIITVIRIIGVCVAIVMLLTIAMKYMTAAPGDKADIKKSAVGYVVGAIVLFGVTGILGIINNFASGIK